MMRRTCATPPCAPSKGFTLLELVIVLVVMAMAAAVIVTRTGNSSGITQRAAVDGVVSMLREARAGAMKSQTDHIVYFDTDTLTYFDDSGAMGDLPADQSVDIVAAQRERVSPTTVGIRFLPNGMSTGGQVVIGDGATARAVQVDWLTGRVSVVAGEAGR